MAIKRISSSKCSRVRSTRGSRKSAKYFRGLSISPSQLATTAPHIAIKMRLPCTAVPSSCCRTAPLPRRINLRPQGHTRRRILSLTLLSNAERAEDQVQDVVGGGGAGDVVQGTQRAVEIQQHHLVRCFHGNRAGCLVERSNCVLH